MTEKRVLIHTTIDAETLKIIQKGIESHRWHNLGHAIDYCVNHTIQFSGRSKT